MDQSLASGARTLKAVAPRSEVRSEGELQACLNCSVAGDGRVVPCLIISVCASAMRIVRGYQVNALPTFSTA